MTTTSSSAIAFAALLANLAFAATGCGVFGADEPSAPNEAEPSMPERNDAPAAETPTAPAVGGPASTSELTDALGIFVSLDGQATADGTHDRPLNTIQAGIDKAKAAGKRVYVCTGAFQEALVIASSISVIGGLDCTNNEWHVGAARTRVVSPTSPAVRASSITAATRLEGLEIFAPNATAPSGSSIGLVADHSPALVVASSKIIAGNAMKGVDGTEGTQLSNAPTASGTAFSNTAHCTLDTCGRTFTGLWARPDSAPPGTNICQGAPGHEAQPGGLGGSGGLYEVKQDVNYYFDFYRGDATYGADNGNKNRTSAAGANGNDGSTPAPIGTFTTQGYVPASGTPGTDGKTGSGGEGGNGRSPSPTVNPNTMPVSGVWRGYGGASGGAGGCPGLAGTAGTGGGASIAALLIESAMSFDGTDLVSGRGGDAGLGTLGSAPTPGGNAGPNFDPANFPFLSARPGGRGGAAGVSGNGSAGPSLGIAHVGAKPEVRADSKITIAGGGAAIAARSRTDALGITKTIPATPAGVAKDILAL
jgi:hypothetical protein